jgi:hypothetical protein
LFDSGSSIGGMPEQADDGRYRNANGRVKEGDPLIATTFAIQMITRAGTQQVVS